MKSAKEYFEEKYVLKIHSIDNLKNLGFRKYKDIISDEENYYYYQFPVLEWKRIPCLNCNIIIDTNSGDMRIDVYDVNNNVYPIFYNNDTNSDLLPIIKKRIRKEFTKIGIIKHNITRGE